MSTTTTTTAAQPMKPFAEQLAFRQLTETTWTTVHPPQRMGNTLPIAYGGYALAVACKAAVLSAPQTHHIYSALGNFLGPASTARPLLVSVRTVRQTRTFGTRHVEVSQQQDDGSTRVCLFAAVDFHAKEKEEGAMVFSRPPSDSYSGYADLPSTIGAAKALLDAGKITAAQCETFANMFAVNTGLFDIRPCPEGVFAQNLNGLAKKLPHSQDGVPLTRRRAADWFRSKTVLETRADHVAALAFVSDGALSFAPLSFDHKFLDDCAACTSLDFALRVFGPVDLNAWSFREISTTVGGEGRSFSESWMWDENGRAVASMSQQAMMRGLPGKGKL